MTLECISCCFGCIVHFLLSQTSWTEEEKQALKDIVQEHRSSASAVMTWDDIAKELNDTCDNDRKGNFDH